MENKNEKGVKKIVRISVGAAALVGAVGICALLFVLLRSCTAENSGKEPYTVDFIEKWLEESYAADFTFVEQYEDNSDKYFPQTIYTYTDTNGVRTNVLQIREPGAMLSPNYYTVEDNYQAARMFADSGFLEKLDSSGYEYELVTENSSLGSALGICICKMNAQRFEDISGVADVLYDAAESCNYPPAADNEKYGAKNDIFSHHAAYLGITTKNDYVLGFLNVYVNTGPDSYLKAELEPKADVIAKAEDYYRLFSERGYIDGEFPTDESR